MGQNSKIEWTDHTFNPWRGCAKVSAGCDYCYAERYGTRDPVKFGRWGDDGWRVIAAESTWKTPLAWDAEARRAGMRRRVFCGSLMDVFEDRPELIRPRARLFRLICDTPELDWLLLTKRPENAKAMIWAAMSARLPCEPHILQVEALENVLPNFWLGISVENQAAWQARRKWLLECPAAGRFISYEPALGPFDNPELTSIDWVIAGGETGPRARPAHPQWFRDVRNQCQTAGVPFFLKSLGEYVPWEDCPQDLLDKPALEAHGRMFIRVGKKAAGRLLDGREWNELPAMMLSKT